MIGYVVCASIACLMSVHLGHKVGYQKGHDDGYLQRGQEDEDKGVSDREQY